MKGKREKGYRRHNFVYRTLWWPVKLLLKIKFNYTAEEAPDIEAPYIVLSNHNINWDPFFVACAFKKYMYFVASEHIFRWGWLSKLIVWLVSPIARAKGMTDGGAALAILRAIKQGRNVCIFPEGNMSWDGVTCSLHPTTARIVKASKASLVTFRIRGGYLTKPRWCTLMRRGKMSGRVINIYTPEQIKAMTEEELHSVIERDLYENAFEVQREEMIQYNCKVLAQNLETAIYMCPQCGGVCTMHSDESRFYCDCGFNVIYNHYGFFESSTGNVPFETVYEWDRWQNEKLREMEFGDEPIYTDENQVLMRLTDDHKQHVEARGTLALYRDRLVLGDFELPVEQIHQVAIHGRETIVFSSQGIGYEIYSKMSRSGRKYVTMIEILLERAGRKTED